MKSNILIIIIASLISLSCYCMTPQDIVKDIFKAAKNQKIISSKKQQASINNNIGFNQMAINILGNEAKKINQAEVKWFQKTIKDIITKTVYPKAPDFLNQVEISYEKPDQEKKNILIRSIVKKKGEETEVSYKFSKINNKWIIVDIAIDDESWTETIADQVRQTIKKEKWVGLKKKLTKRLKELNSAKK